MCATLSKEKKFTDKKKEHVAIETMSRPGVIGRFWANFTRSLQVIYYIFCFIAYTSSFMQARKTLERRVVGHDHHGNTFYVAIGDREDKATNR